MRRGSGGLTALVAALVVLLPGTAWAGVVADWEMNEPAGATQMTDSSGHGLTGQVGARVRSGVATPSGRGYGFRGAGHDQDPALVVVVPDRTRLDAGTRRFSVTVRFRTSTDGPNLVQKGQSGEPGGYWKVEVHKGWPTCFFRDATGGTKAIGFVGGEQSLRVDDNRWHTLRCERRSDQVRITLEPGTRHQATRRVLGRVGNIANSRPVVIGGKLDCSGTEVGCDYLSGRVDWVRIQRG
jgi:hypothetical protein